MRKLVAVFFTVSFFSAVASAETFSWSQLRRADGNVEDFSGQAWFCQAKTTGGNTECAFGAKPPKPGCYVILNQAKAAWVSVDDVADKLKAGRHTPEAPMTGLSGYGCGTPKSTDYWLVVK